MEKKNKTTNNDLKKIVKKVIKETRHQGGFVYNKFTYFVDAVNDRIREYGDEYTDALQSLNDSFEIPRKGGRVRTPGSEEFRG